MSEDTKTETRNHLNREDLLKIVQDSGAEYEELSKYDRVGPKKGPHLMISRAKKTTLIYGYTVQAGVPGVTNFSPEDRKTQKLGGITCQVDVASPDALSAFRTLVELVKTTEA